MDKKRYLETIDKKHINICFSIDKRYVDYCATTITSILLNSIEHIHFFVVISDINWWDRKKIESLKKIRNFEVSFIKVNLEMFKNYYIPEGSHFSLANYFRLHLSSLIPDIDKVIYLDSDVLVLKDIKHLWNVNIADYYLGGCKSMVSERNCSRLGFPVDLPYINSGVMLLNLVKIRNNNLEKLFTECVNKNYERLKNVDQDVINITLLNKNDGIFQLKQNWNTEFRTDLEVFKEYFDIIYNPYIIHFITNDKPWIKGSKQKNKDLYKEYYKKTKKTYFWYTKLVDLIFY